MSVLAIIPARGGSKGLRRKNLLLLGDRPLFLHAAYTCRQVADRVVVSTEDAEIAGVARVHGFEVVDRPAPLYDDDATIVQVCRDVVARLGWEGGVLCVQPTVPLVTVQTLRGFLALSASTIGTVPLDHLLWIPGQDRVNRQQLRSYHAREIGIYWWPNIIGEPHQAQGIPTSEAVDIDTWSDLQAARQQVDRGRVVFRVAATREIGSGHLHRCLQLAEELQGHTVGFRIEGEEWARNLVHERGWLVGSGGWDSDVVIFDKLDTTTDEILDARYHSRAVVTLEDLGGGGRFADLVINSLYGPHDPWNWPHVEYGARWHVLRPEFLGLPEYQVRESPERVLVTFGGTDPSGLSERLAQFPYDWEVDMQIVQPGTSVTMAVEMMNADLVITSAGRTVYEAAAVGVPTIVLAQNLRETTHTHLGAEHGNLYLGLGRLVTDGTIQDQVSRVLADVELRREMSVRARASVDGKGVRRIVRRIEDLMEGL